MTRILYKIIVLFISNLAALAAITYFIEGFRITPNAFEFLTVTAIFTLINLFIRPIIKLIFSPIIIITLGLGIVLVNAATLYILDFFSGGVSIEGPISLFYASLAITVVHFLIHFITKKI